METALMRYDDILVAHGLPLGGVIFISHLIFPTRTKADMVILVISGVENPKT
jgi:hypothetical protein